MNKVATITHGFKQTPLGPIPSDWVIELFENVFSFLKTFSFSREELTEPNDENYIKCIHYGDIHSTFESEIIDVELERGIPTVKKSLISEDELKDPHFPWLKDGDLIIADASEDYEGLTKSIELKNIKENKIISGLHTFAARDKSGKTAIGFRTYSLMNPFIRKEVHRIGQGISVYGISKPQLSKFLIPLPPLPEQTAIANLLSTWDKAIETTQKLIAQKELRKKWLMQVLLTGKKRIKGNSENLKETSLNKTFVFIKTYSLTRDELTTNPDLGSIYCIHYGDIHAQYNSEFLDFTQQTLIPKIAGQYKVNERDLLKDGDLIIADASEDYDGVGEAVEVINIQGKKAVGGLHTFVLRDISGNTENGFRAYLFSSELLRNNLRRKATGISVYGISKTTLEKLSFGLPEKQEQTAIAQILSSADKEIRLLQTKLNKLKEQKKGLMQVLLTGKKRIRYDI